MFLLCFEGKVFIFKRVFVSCWRVETRFDDPSFAVFSMLVSVGCVLLVGALIVLPFRVLCCFLCLEKSLFFYFLFCLLLMDDGSFFLPLVFGCRVCEGSTWRTTTFNSTFNCFDCFL